MRRLALCFSLASIGLVVPAIADAADPVPGFDLDDAIACLAYTTADAELSIPGADLAKRAQEMVYFSRLIAVKSTAEDHAAFDARFADRLALMRSLHAEMDDPAKRDEADDILTGTGKMCWYQALAAEGGPYFEN